jgi:hypothetical protein
VGLQALENKVLSWGIIGKSAPILAEITIRKSQHLAELRDRLLQEHPQLVKFIENQVGKYPSKLHNAMFGVIMGVTSVLNHQAMVDNKGNKNID